MNAPQFSSQTINSAVVTVSITADSNPTTERQRAALIFCANVPCQGYRRRSAILPVHQQRDLSFSYYSL
ncbi:hypothetical protein KCP75_03755 [Salmonella enterica subsp. enterica]|nr:hypothetical protein KCP75_03755 [Salmonella enterica subsp. enterica]